MRVYERNEMMARNGKGSKSAILLVGAGQAGGKVVGELGARAQTCLDIKGFIDDDLHKCSTKIQGLEVLGTTADIPRIAHELNIDEVIITIGNRARAAIHRIIKLCEQAPVRIRIIPASHELVQGQRHITEFRELQIEDWLGCDTVQLDETTVEECLMGKRVMVTGAGGSIGAELVRQIVGYGPAKLLLVERAEFCLFNIHRELDSYNHRLPTVVPLLADINDRSRMRAIFKEYRPQVVLHAAAHKHVPIVEANPAEAIKNNVLATNLIGELAGEYGVEVFVLISTDKAVNPTSVMGASKRMAELVVQHLDQRFAGTRYLAVRFGNVIGSTGSVVSIFQEQIRNGGPVTVTDKRMERYFMTIPDAARLVLQAGAIGQGGEIFTLKMGAPVRIYELAKEMITRAGLMPNGGIKIKIIGPRPGEKFFEELEANNEQHDRTRHPQILIGRLPAYPPEEVITALARLHELVNRGDYQEIRMFMNSFLPEARLEVDAVQTLLRVPEQIALETIIERDANLM